MYLLERDLDRISRLNNKAKVESRMHKTTQTSSTPRKAWTAPRLAKLGTIGDVADSLTRAPNQNPVFS